MAEIGAQRKQVSLPTDFRSPPENGHSRYAYPTARFAPLPTFAVAAHRRDTELPFLRKDFQRLLSDSLHRADIGNCAVADARDTELGQALSRRHAVHNHHIDGQRYAIAAPTNQCIVPQTRNEEAGRTRRSI